MTNPASKPACDSTFAAFLEEERQGLQAFVRKLCVTGEDPDDVVQETLGRAWRYRSSFDEGGNPGAWLRRTAFNVFVDQRRERRRAPRLLEPDRAEPQVDHRCRAELDDEVEHALRLMTPLERDLLLAMHRDGHTLAELASRHAMPLNTIKSHIHRARQKLPGGTR